MQIYTGLGLSRKRLDWQALRADGTLVGAGAVPPDPDRASTSQARKTGAARSPTGEAQRARTNVRAWPRRLAAHRDRVSSLERFIVDTARPFSPP